MQTPAIDTLRCAATLVAAVCVGCAFAGPALAADSYTGRVAERPSLLSYWRLSDASGTTAVDAKGGRNGTYQNGVGLGAAGALPADPDKAAQFDGVNDQVTLPTLPSSANFTVEGWQKLDANAVSNNALYAQAGTMRLMPRPIGYYAGVWAGGAEYILQGNGATNTGTWVHWALVRSGSTLRLYRNGVQVATRADLPATGLTVLSGSIGRYGTTYPAKGTIDDVSVNSAALSAADIAGDYAGRTVAPDGGGPPDPPDPPDEPAGPRYVDRDSLGGACSDTRTSPEAASPSTPWCSMSRALAAAPSGATVLVRAGSYPQLDVTDRNPAAAMTFKAFTGEQPALDGVSFLRSSRFAFEGFRITEVPLIDTSSQLTFRGNDVSPHGFRVKSGSNLTIENNFIHDLTITGGGACQDNIHCGYGYRANTASDVTIKGNHFKHIPGDGIQAGTSTTYTIENNDFEDINPFVDPNEHADAIQMYASSTNTVIRGNYIHGELTRGPLLGDSVGGDSQINMTIENNVIVPARDWGLVVYNAPGLKVANNTIWGTGNAEGLSLRTAATTQPTSNASVFNNVLSKLSADASMFSLEDYNLVGSGYRAGAHDLAGPPRFADFNTGDVRLIGGSPGIDAGTSTGAPTADFAGHARVDTPTIPNTGGGAQPFFDMGAYEFSGSYTPPAGSYADTILAEPGLFGYWRLGDPLSSPTAADSKGSFTGTPNGPLFGSAGAPGMAGDTAAWFDGVNDQVSLPALPSTTDFTIEGWTKLEGTTPTGNNTLLGQVGSVRFMPRTAGFYIGVWIGGTEYISQGPTPANTGTWVHWAAVRSGSTLTVYRQGQQVGIKAVPATGQVNLTGAIGRYTGSYPAKGSIDEVALYNTALSAAQLQRHYDVGRTAP